MLSLAIKNTNPRYMLESLQQAFGGAIVPETEGARFTFAGEAGNGSVRFAQFDRGITLLEFDVEFREETTLVFSPIAKPPMKFIFISEGQIGFRENGDPEFLTLERFQNIILSPKQHTQRAYRFPAYERVRMNMIQLNKGSYLQKKHNRIRCVHEELISVFEDINSLKSFRHTGNYNLKIADEVRELERSLPSSELGGLSTEGRLYLILAMQLLEFGKYEDHEWLPESISREDIRKIHQLSDYIAANISENLSIEALSRRSGLSPKKLQLGFQVLFSKSVNAFVRTQKLEIARDLLHNSDKNISEIVYEIGFRSRSYFSRIFSQQYGILPTQYRRQVRKPSAT